MPRCAQGRDPASLMHHFNSFSGSAVSVAIPPWRFARRVCDVATGAHACLNLAWVHCVICMQGSDAAHADP